MPLMRTALMAGWILLLASAGLAADIDPRDPALDRESAPPFGDTEHLGSPSLRGIVPEERIIQNRLDTTESRVLRRSQRPIEQRQLQRDLGAAGQRIDAFKTMHPNARATPLFERHLDRLERPARIREPNSPGLLGGPTSILER
jgi:hypothetical protein